MKHAIVSASLAGSLQRKIEAIAAAQYEGFELYEPDLTVSMLTPTQIRNFIASCGLRLLSLQPLRNIEGLPVEQFRLRLRYAERKLDLAAELGAEMVIVASNTGAEALSDDARAADQMAQLAERAQQRGIRIGYEALPWGRHVTDYRHAMKIVEHARHENLGVVLDGFNILSVCSEVDAIRHLTPERIAMVQLADAISPCADIRHHSRHHRCFPGQGALPLRDFVSAVQACGYDGWISLEIFNDEFQASRIDLTALDGRRSLTWLGVQEKRTPGVAAIDGNVQGLEFIEFATDPDSQSELTALLGHLGLTETHRHRSKDVSLYRAGNVDIVVNRMRGSHAADYYDKHGTAVCAVGVRVSSVEPVVAWAESLRYERFESDAEVGELRLPAILGPGDVLYYLLEEDPRGRTYRDVDFVPTGASPGVQVASVDHLGQVARSEYFHSTLLFYRTMLGLDAAAPVDLWDPHGVVHSRRLRNASGEIRISLTTTRAWAAAPGRFIDAFGGAGIQEIAIASANLLDVARRLPREAILPIPANYYRDLSARKPLDVQLLADLEQFNVLYHEEQTGAYLQLYLRPVSGLFFAIVQRLGDYDGCGEEDARVRLAAQEEDWRRVLAGPSRSGSD
ncbi:MAG TPA: TIM barrel protein [Steroidobacter sp.]|uniref:bifunctional sugar phosphate isomerase/epimerase/4-hydroxyphenylpyruvate dioxygenase family protein n=1 Tax=Steroidobacter sp. TaxID=1978227 RepID=UPI002ED88DD2